MQNQTYGMEVNYGTDFMQPQQAVTSLYSAPATTGMGAQLQTPAAMRAPASCAYSVTPQAMSCAYAAPQGTSCGYAVTQQEPLVAPCGYSATPQEPLVAQMRTAPSTTYVQGPRLY